MSVYSQIRSGVVRFSVFLVLGIGAAGCTCGSGDGRFLTRQANDDVQMTALRDVRLMQAVNPPSDMQRAPVVGMHGPAAALAMQSYTESFKPAKKEGGAAGNTFFLGLQGVGGN